MSEPRRIPLLHEMNPWGQEVALEYYGAGVKIGWEDGYRAAEADMAALQRRCVAIARSVASHPPYDEMCELRGEPERAKVQRQLLKERGIFP